MKYNIYEILASLAKDIQSRYPTFASAYPLVKTDFEKGLTLSYDGKKWVNILDAEGNYFYIRIDAIVPASFSKSTTFSDCDLTITENYNCVLVAIASSDIDEILLKDALTAQVLSSGYVVNQNSFDMVSIMRGELKGIDKKVIESALSKMGNKIVVSITFKFQRIFSSSNCAIDICKTC